MRRLGGRRLRNQIAPAALIAPACHTLLCYLDGLVHARNLLTYNGSEALAEYEAVQERRDARE